MGTRALTAHSRSDVTVPMLRATRLAAYGALAVYTIYRTHVAGFDGLHLPVTSIMVTSIDTIPMIGASCPWISTLPLLPRERCTPVGIARCKNANYGRALNKRVSAITHAGACRYVSQAHDACAQAHGRLEW